MANQPDLPSIISDDEFAASAAANFTSNLEKSATLGNHLTNNSKVLANGFSGN
jgi:hypothetical protein